MSYSDQNAPIVANHTGAFDLSAAELNGQMWVTIICNNSVRVVTTLGELAEFILAGGIGLGIGAAGLTATGTTQATAFLVQTVFNVFATVPLNAGVMLPPGYSSVIPIQIVNNGANPERVYPFFGDQIAGYGVDQPVLVESGGGAVAFTCFDPIIQPQPRTWWPGGGGGVVGLLNDGGVLVVTLPGIFPTSNVGLSAGDLYSNGGVVSVVPGTTPNPAAPPVIFGLVGAAELFALGGANLPIVRPTAGSLIIWNAGGELWVA